MAAYNILRAFSWQIRLSPFAFEELCAALFMPNPSPLMDELHVSLDTSSLGKPHDPPALCMVSMASDLQQ